MSNTIRLAVLVVLLISVSAFIGYASSAIEITINNEGTVTQHYISNLGNTTLGDFLEDIEYKEEIHEINYGKEDILYHGIVIEINQEQFVRIEDPENDYSYGGFIKFMTIKELLNKKDITMGEYDKINYSLDDKIKDGLVIEIERAKKITLTDINTEEEVFYVFNHTVEDFLIKNEISLNEHDLLNIEKETLLTNNMGIEITRIEKEEYIKSEEISYKTITRNNPKLKSGVKNILQEGVTGEKEIYFEKIYKNGEVVSDEKLDEKIIKEEVNKIIEIGTKVEKPKSTPDVQPVSRSSNTRSKPVSSTSSSSDCNVARRLTVEATAYTSEDPGVGNTTFTGTRLRHGVIAVDPRVIPLGTKMNIPGYGIGYAEDTGGAIKGNKIDLAYSSRDAALRFGRQTMTIEICK